MRYLFQPLSRVPVQTHRRREVLPISDVFPDPFVSTPITDCFNGEKKSCLIVVQSDFTGIDFYSRVGVFGAVFAGFGIDHTADPADFHPLASLPAVLTEADNACAEMVVDRGAAAQRRCSGKLA
ncbi:hypothetical protein V2J84_19275 [Pseudomonas alliivorans]|nr:hypothetical protein [Pseudomonas alliivorans]